MRLHSLKMRNFRQHVRTEISFGPGLTGIIGPNGAGKTTILEAIAWALYGNQAVRGNRESIRFIGAGPRAQVDVELDFELGAHRYRVVRGLTDAKVYLDGADEPIANSISAVTELLQRRLGMSLSEFFHTYFTGQKELSVMAALTPSKRGQFLSRVLGYEKLRIAQELTRDKRNRVKAAIDGMQRGLPDPEAVLRALAEASAGKDDAEAKAQQAAHRAAVLQREFMAVEPRWEMAQKQREQAALLLTQITVAEEKEAALNRDAQRIERELEGIADAHSQLDSLRLTIEPLFALNVELQALNILYREEGRRKTLVEAESALLEEIARLKDRHTKIERAPALEEEATLELEKVRAELENTQGLLEARRTEWVRDRQEAATKREALRQQYTELKQQRERVVALGEDGECPTCSRALGGSLHTVVEHLDEMIETVNVDGNYYRARVEQLEVMPDDVRELDEKRRLLTQEVGTLERRLAKVQLAVQELGTIVREIAAKQQRLVQMQRDISRIPPGFDPVRHAEVIGEVERLTPIEAEAARFQAMLEREPQIKLEQTRIAQELMRVQSILGTLRTRHTQVFFAEKEFGELKKDYERVRVELQEAKLSAARAQEQVASATRALDGAQRTVEDLKRKQEELDAMQADRRMHDELDRAFSDLRTDLNYQLRPELSELASAFLSELTDARYTELELDDQYNIVILEDGIPKPVISGGEEDLANLVLRLAISQMIAERAGQSFSLLILDEVFGSLDEARRFNVVELLRGLQDRFEQVILITHIEPVREGLDRVISVSYDIDRGCSVVQQSEPEWVDREDLPSLLVPTPSPGRAKVSPDYSEAFDSGPEARAAG
ncbi:MAG TPA: SMC family ATPase [Gemmatimonadaceae bacterium]|nr:SMC family ATPase [Gemmatimonadaceae bacterium]